MQLHDHMNVKDNGELSSLQITQFIDSLLT